jgi:hypothetical protein
MPTNHHARSFNWRLALSATLVAALGACGGGGGGDDDPSPNTPEVGAGAIDKYVGTLVTACFQTQAITDATTAAVLNNRSVLRVLSKTSPTRAPVEIKLESYAAPDCSGTPKNTVTVNGAGTFLLIDGTATIGSDTVDKISLSRGPFFPGLSGATISVNGVNYDGATYGAQTTDVFRDIFLFRGADLYAGDISKPLDAQGYPTVLGTTPTLTKQ